MACRTGNVICSRAPAAPIADVSFVAYAHDTEWRYSHVPQPEHPTIGGINDDELVCFACGDEKFAIRTQGDGLRPHAGQFYLPAEGRKDLVGGSVVSVGGDLADAVAGGEAVFRLRTRLGRKTR